jgi:hypothetical protein
LLGLGHRRVLVSGLGATRFEGEAKQTDLPNCPLSSTAFRSSSTLAMLLRAAKF